MVLPVLVGLVRVNRPGPGRPRSRLDGLAGDRAYSSKANRRILRTRRTRCTIPERGDQKANRRRRGSTGGRPPDFDREAYRRRNRVERLMNRRKQYRALATRYDKLATTFRATVRIVDILIRLRARPDRPTQQDPPNTP
ncbi:IS5 family transposase [Nocardiopsis sp. CNR-923]|nr:IS5 family transposase [Nocardiopsis sp. CNR-923]